MNETQKLGFTPSSEKKPKPWTDIEEEALARAWIDVARDPEAMYQLPLDSFWKECLYHFELQLGYTGRTARQLNSKWKDMNKKIKAFNILYNFELSNRQVGHLYPNALSTTNIKYRKRRKNKDFPHQLAWEVVKDDPSWKARFFNSARVQSAKTPKTSNSNNHTTSSDAPFSKDHNDADEGIHCEEPEKPEQKDKKSASSSTSSEQQQLLKIVSDFSSINEEDIEDKKRYRAEKLRLMKEEKEKKMQEKEKKMLILEQELRLMEQKEMDKDMQFLLKPHDNLTGMALNAVLARKRKIGERWGWE